jgi:hypothetical protein
VVLRLTARLQLPDASRDTAKLPIGAWKGWVTLGARSITQLADVGGCESSEKELDAFF